MKKTNKILDLLGEIYQEEMAGITRYLHYSFMIMGTQSHSHSELVSFQCHRRDDPCHTDWRKDSQVLEDTLPWWLQKPKRCTTTLWNNSSRKVCVLRKKTLGLYKKLVVLATDIGDIALEELARSQVKVETEHADEVRQNVKISGLFLNGFSPF